MAHLKDMSPLPDSVRVPTLAEKQAQLAIALAGQADPPPGFDEVRLSRASAALASFNSMMMRVRR